MIYILAVHVTHCIYLLITDHNISFKIKQHKKDQRIQSHQSCNHKERLYASTMSPAHHYQWPFHVVHGALDSSRLSLSFNDLLGHLAMLAAKTITCLSQDANTWKFCYVLNTKTNHVIITSFCISHNLACANTRHDSQDWGYSKMKIPSKMNDDGNIISEMEYWTARWLMFKSCTSPSRGHEVAIMLWGPSMKDQRMIYPYISNIRHTLLGKKIVDHSDVAGAAPVGAAPTTSSFSTSTPGFNGLSKDNCKTRQKTIKFKGIWCDLY